MTDQEINQAIAEWCGESCLYVLHKPIHDPFGYYRPNANGYTGNIAEAWKVPLEIAKKHINGHTDQPDRVVAEPAPVRDYCSDLNAMHEAEERLTQDHREDYWWRLLDVAESQNVSSAAWQTAHATARQRAEALLKTIGRWRE